MNEFYVTINSCIEGSPSCIISELKEPLNISTSYKVGISEIHFLNDFKFSGGTVEFTTIGWKPSNNFALAYFRENKRYSKNDEANEFENQFGNCIQIFR